MTDLRSTLNTTLLKPCPFCEGPPVPIATSMSTNIVVRDEDLSSPWGCSVIAKVFCHECGADGPWSDGLVYSREGVNELIGMAVAEWNERSAKNRELFDLGEKEGLNKWPRL